MDLQALKAELTAGHPGTGPYSSDDEVAANQLNAPNRQPNRDTLDSGLLVASIVRTEYDALTAPAKDYLRLIAMAQTLPLTPTLKTELAGIFGVGTTTRANLVALLKRPGSRAEELGLGLVNASNVADARRLP